MKIYSQKQRWKLALLIAAVVIIAASLWYTNILVQKIGDEERQKVQLWADAIQKKADLVNYTNVLFDKIKTEERKKVELWAEATRQLNAVELSDYSFVLKVVTDNTTVPVILADEKGNIKAWRNLDSSITTNAHQLLEEMEIMKDQNPPIEIPLIKGHKDYVYFKNSKIYTELKVAFDGLIRSFNSEITTNAASVPVIYTDSTRTKVLAFGNMDSLRMNDPEYLQSALLEMEEEHEPIQINLSSVGKSYIFYKDSSILIQLKYYPYAQFGVIALFLLIAYGLFSTARNAEQNQVWVGMAKETAHQLGTPLSSLLAWLELLKAQAVDPDMIVEIEKDLKRLGTITERFSKIGSAPVLERQNLIRVLEDSVTYVRSRTSRNVTFTIDSGGQKEVNAQLNVPLFEWVIENICKNAVDAMTGNGSILIQVSDQTQFIYIDITDTGKGMTKSKYKTIFEPGYTTKTRGWGLGLSLCKRIMENYHKGDIFVKRSEPDKGTTFRIVLNK